MLAVLAVAVDFLIRCAQEVQLRFACRAAAAVGVSKNADVGCWLDALDEVLPAWGCIAFRRLCSSELLREIQNPPFSTCPHCRHLRSGRCQRSFPHRRAPADAVNESPCCGSPGPSAAGSGCAERAMAQHTVFGVILQCGVAEDGITGDRWVSGEQILDGGVFGFIRCRWACCCARAVARTVRLSAVLARRCTSRMSASFWLQEMREQWVAVFRRFSSNGALGIGACHLGIFAGAKRERGVAFPLQPPGVDRDGIVNRGVQGIDARGAQASLGSRWSGCVKPFRYFSRLTACAAAAPRNAWSLMAALSWASGTRRLLATCSRKPLSEILPSPSSTMPPASSAQRCSSVAKSGSLR